MNQTVKFGKLRAKNDPDRDNVNDGVHYGLNHSRKIPPKSNRTCVTRGSWVRRTKA
jgi:hypothetical protein